MNRASFDEESWIGVRWAEGCVNRPSAVHRCGSGRSPWMFLLCQEIDFISQCYFIPLSPRFLRNGRQGCILHKTVSCVNYLFGLLFGLPATTEQHYGHGLPLPAESSGNPPDPLCFAVGASLHLFRWVSHRGKYWPHAPKNCTRRGAWAAGLRVSFRVVWPFLSWR